MRKRVKFVYYLWFENEAETTLIAGTGFLSYIWAKVQINAYAINRLLPWNWLDPSKPNPARICEVSGPPTALRDMLRDAGLDG